MRPLAASAVNHNQSNWDEQWVIVLGAGGILVGNSGGSVVFCEIFKADPENCRRRGA